MISYKPFYQTLCRMGLTEYYLIFKQGLSANTLHRIILDCRVEDIIEYVKDE